MIHRTASALRLAHAGPRRRHCFAVGGAAGRALRGATRGRGATLAARRRAQTSAHFQVVQRLDADADGTPDAQATAQAFDAAAPVHLTKQGDQWSLVADGAPLTVEGVGFDYTRELDSAGGKWFTYVDPEIQRVGANAIRSYGVPRNDADGAPVDQAATITSLLEYADTASTPSNKVWIIAPIYGTGTSQAGLAPAQQLSTADVTAIAKAVYADKNADHLLAWVVGNEVNEQGLLQSYVNSRAGALRTVMASNNAYSRPIMHSTECTSGTDTQRVKALVAMGNVDALGFNCYYGHFGSTTPLDPGLSTEAQDLWQAGLRRPWLVSEFLTYDLGSNADPGLGAKLNGGTNYLFELNSTDRSADFTRNWTCYIARSATSGCDNQKTPGGAPAAVQNAPLGGIAIKQGPPHNSKSVAYWEEFYAYTGDFKAFVNPTWTGGQTLARLGYPYALSALWQGTFSGSPPQIVLGSDRDPQGITADFKVSAASAGRAVAPGKTLVAAVNARPAAGGPSNLTFTWYLQGGSAAGFTGDINGKGQNVQFFGQSTSARVVPSPAPPPNTGQQLKGTQATTRNGTLVTDTLTFTAPSPTVLGNNYQLRVIVTDGSGGAATAAIPFRMTT